MVYEPFLGLCTVVGSSEETMLGVQQIFFELKPLHGTAKVKVPALQMVSRGIRPLMSAEQLEVELEADGQVEDPGRETYAQRLKRWTQLLRSGRTASAYDFLREWQKLSELGTRFSPKETEMYENVQRVIVQEISEVLQISSGKASSRLIQRKEKTQDVKR
eukprot:TRINITY_DN95222_c0_g1_i1.p1 TRINITY_DN95222_c0_g1~~TRINITY_DN95222_c0_g1_i1.p1  ORF type:complete len:189 (-),score=31.17 TRINITY_DN95222_c0_g1_i1:1002-1484(-)